jgi:hypothetical protein
MVLRDDISGLRTARLCQPIVEYHAVVLRQDKWSVNGGATEDNEGKTHEPQVEAWSLVTLSESRVLLPPDFLRLRL